mgnify:FL=1|jgi:hypothetical protein|tara:strand:- start:558 stop:1187 length:630 start_codon:yes stop_codon:yes gene_type:complete
MEKANPNLQEYERKPDFNTKHRPDFNPRNYKSIQDRVNSDPEYEISYIDKLISDGWYKLQEIRSILSEEMKGRHFKYRLNGKSLSGAEKGTFRSGGMIIGRSNDDKIGKYVMYKAYNGCIFPLQLNDVFEIYTRDPAIKIPGSKKETSISKTVFFTQPTTTTLFPVHLLSNLNGEKVIIYYGRDKYSQNRFTQSKKYEYALRTGDWAII